MSDRRFIFLSVLLLAAVVGVMSWRGMHPQPGVARQADIVSGYYADVDATAALVPDDGLPVTIAQGTFIYAADKKTGFTFQGMPPALFAQRQVNVLLRFKGMPENPAGTFAKMDSLLEGWKRQGINVSIILLDYRPKTPDFRSYSKFIKAAKKHFSADPHLFVPVADAAWLDQQQKGELRLLREDAPFFLFDAGRPGTSPELLLALESFGYNFQLLLPATGLPAGIGESALRKNSFFGGSLLTLDPRKPFVKREEKIGLFPRL